MSNKKNLENIKKLREITGVVSKTANLLSTRIREYRKVYRIFKKKRNS